MSTLPEKVVAEHLSDSEIKEIQGLEYLTKLQNNSNTKIGFSKGKFVILEFNGISCNEIKGARTEIRISDSFYEMLRQQAEKGEYRSAREFAEGMLKPIEQFGQLY